MLSRKVQLCFCALVLLVLVLWRSQMYYVRSYALSASQYANETVQGTGTYRTVRSTSEGGLDWNSTKLMHSNGSITVSRTTDLRNTPGKTDRATLPHTMLNRTTPSVQHGYVLVTWFVSRSQQAVGLRAFMSPQCWIGSFGLPMYIVEPFIEDSIVHTYPQRVRNTTLLSLSNFYDLEHYNAQSKLQGMAEVVTWEDFVDRAPRQVIVVIRRHRPHGCICLPSINDTRGQPPKIIWKSSETDRCKSRWKGHAVNVTTLAELGFCVVMVVAIFPNPYICSEEEMYSLIFGGRKPSDVTLLIDAWCPNMYIPNLSLPDPKLCQHACSEGLVNKYLPSAQLINHIEAYESNSSFDRGKHGVKLAVMLRTEHILIPLPAKKRKIAMKLCLARTLQLVRTLQGRLGVNQPFITVDIGKYGSNAWKAFQLYEHIMKDIKSTTVDLLNHSLTFEEWEDTFATVTEGITDRGYIAALQQNIASRADCIVLLGGGNFLRLALHEYLNLHPEIPSWCIYFVCVEERFMDEYTTSIAHRSRHKATLHRKLLPEDETLNLYIGAFNFSDFT